MIIASLIPLSIAFIGLLIGTYTDIRTREVPDWVNYGLIGAGLSLGLLYSVIFSEWSYIVNSLIGFGVFFLVAVIMFYTGQWGGGDSKMVMALGALIGIDISFKEFPFLIGFFINMLLIGAVYGIVWSFVLAFKNRNKFLREVKKRLTSKKIMLTRRLLLISSFIILVSVFFIEDFFLKITMFHLALIIFSTFYLWIFIKAVEKTSMLKYVKPAELTEGDWIEKDVFVDGKRICGKKDLGIEKKQIRKLIQFYKKKKVNKILIKEGIPFIPSFLIAFIVTLLFGNVFFWFI